MPITIHQDGGYIVEGSEGMKLYRMLNILGGLKLELKGIRLTAKAPKCSTIVRREFGLKGNLERLIEQFKILVDVQSAKVTRVDEHGVYWAGEGTKHETGSDNPSCPKCGHYNAMMWRFNGPSVCRDCGYEGTR